MSLTKSRAVLGQEKAARRRLSNSNLDDKRRAVPPRPAITKEAEAEKAEDHHRPGRGLRNRRNGSGKARGPESGSGKARIRIIVVESVVLIFHGA